MLFLQFKVGKENAELALSLVGYEEELKVCFQWARVMF
jgi:hypothetical protein